VTPDFRIVPDPLAAYRAAAHFFAAFAREAASSRGRFTVALAGGSTPRAMHSVLAAEPAGVFPWDRTTVFFGDERAVPPDDEASNFRMARETLLSRVPVDPARVFRMEGEAANLDDAARRYEADLRRETPDGLDLIFLGMGEDGHTASLFPGSPALDETERWVVAVSAPGTPPPARRITMTLPAIARARRVLFVVTGATKRGAVGRARARIEPLLPAARVRARETLLWIVDEAAAGSAADSGG
jgi:6-phosphogluconolactonase